MLDIQSPISGIVGCMLAHVATCTEDIAPCRSIHRSMLKHTPESVGESPSYHRDTWPYVCESRLCLRNRTMDVAASLNPSQNIDSSISERLRPVSRIRDRRKKVRRSLSRHPLPYVGPWDFVSPKVSAVSPGDIGVSLEVSILSPAWIVHAWTAVVVCPASIDPCSRTAYRPAAVAGQGAWHRDLDHRSGHRSGRVGRQADHCRSRL